jgi:hypothetical protein
VLLPLILSGHLSDLDFVLKDDERLPYESGSCHVLVFLFLRLPELFERFSTLHHERCLEIPFYDN